MKQLIYLIIIGQFFSLAWALDLKIGDPAPTFSAPDSDGKIFDLKNQKGKWTILYFFPKADTPGCTKQAQAFQAKLPELEKLGVKVVGISTDDVKALAKFKQNHFLNFLLISDEDLNITNLYGSKIPFLNYSKRWSFIVDPDLFIRFIQRDVEPIEDANQLYQELIKLKK